jgi:hypothetical protein
MAATPSLGGMFQFGTPSSSSTSMMLPQAGRNNSEMSGGSGDGNSDPTKMFKKSPGMSNIAGLMTNGGGGGFNFNMTPNLNFNFGISNSQPVNNGIIQFS